MQAHSLFGRSSKAGMLGMLQFAEACLFLTAATVAVRLLPFRWYSRFLGEPSGSAGGRFSPECDPRSLIPIIRAMRRGCRYLPFECKCLVQALAARWMLAVRKMSSSAHLGVAKNATGALKAHAWVKVGEFFVTGKEGVEEYSEITLSAAKAAIETHRTLFSAAP
jgi:hypothetical protein